MIIQGKVRDLTPDHREKCSCCGRRIDVGERVFRCADHATTPLILPTEGYKYNGHQVVDLSQAVYCTDCTARFDVTIKRINDKVNKANTP